jgi:gliding motility-associated-like protein
VKTFGGHLLKSILISLCFWFAPTQGFSQCTGGLGVPIFKETFGAGIPTYAPPLSRGTTNYVYSATGCPDSSQYTIVNNLSGCAGWHTLTDHTGDPGGYFMIVSADLLPATVYTRTIAGLCPGSSYEVSAWLTNLDVNTGFFVPIVYFYIEQTDGTIIASLGTDDIPVTHPDAQWNKYVFDFPLPAGTSSIIIRIVNDYWRPPLPIHGGDNFAIDDITFGPAGPSAKIGVNGLPGDTVKIPCNQSPVISSAVGTCYAQNVYQWQISSDGVTWADIPGAAASTYAPGANASGSWFYRLLVADKGNIGSENCRIISNSLMVIEAKFVPPKFQSLSAAICTGEYALPSGKQVNASGVYIDTLLSSRGCDSLITTVNLTVAVKPDLGKDRTICLGDTTTLSPGKFSSYKWQDGSTNPLYKVTAAGTYSVTVTDSLGCMTSDTVEIKENYCSTIPIPNAFTPNGDGINDTWNIPQLQYFPMCTVTIFSRWGQLVFSSIGYPKAWDGTDHGKPLPAGTYYYIVNLHNNTGLLSGFVALLR